MADVARPTKQELAAELGDVVHDLPLFVTAPLYRRWRLHRGATTEFGDFAMLRRMLGGIKARAESLAQDASRPAASWMAAERHVDEHSRLERLSPLDVSNLRVEDLAVFAGGLADTLDQLGVLDRAERGQSAPGGG
jgi:hypothetical protein